MTEYHDMYEGLLKDENLVFKQCIKILSSGNQSKDSLLHEIVDNTDLSEQLAICILKSLVRGNKINYLPDNKTYSLPHKKPFYRR